MGKKFNVLTVSVILILAFLAYDVHGSVMKGYVHSCEYKDRQSELEAMQCNLYWEARGREEGVVGLYAVAFATMNRVKSGRYPNTIRDVVYQKYQYSWNVDGKSDRVYDEVSWKRCKDIALIVMKIKDTDWEFYDITKGALFYHTINIKPYWASDEHKTVTLNSHIFYSDAKRK